MAWRLNVDRGRQWWTPDENADPSVATAFEVARQKYVANRGKAKHSSDRLLRILAEHGLLGDHMDGHRPPVPSHLANDPLSSALHRGIAFFSTMQTEDGHWAGDYGGPMFLLPGLVIACHVTSTVLYPPVRAEMVRYLRNHQNEDGGFGLHIEHHSTMFSTALNYAALRLLGVSAENHTAQRAREWIISHGGAGGVPGWGKFWLSVLGAYDWDGLDPLTPEFWLLPYALPVHPARMWCHCRVVYLPMSHLYGKRAVGPITTTVKELREELYGEPYDGIRWAKFRGYCCEVDVYVKRPKLQRVLWQALTVYEKIWFPGKNTLRKWALDETLLQIRQEDLNTNHIDIGPVNKVINFLCEWFDAPNSPEVGKHRDRIKDYLWLAEDGMKMQGYNGSQLWDTTFTVQAMLAVDRRIIEPFEKTLSKAHHYIDITQVRNNPPNRDRFYRHRSCGAWPFSTRDHGWPIADCTGEGLAGALALQGVGSWIKKDSQISQERLEAAVEMILSYQNPCGGWATYELTRGPEWLELMNPSEVFSDIMIDYPYVECSASSLKGLGEFRSAYPKSRLAGKIEKSIEAGLKYIESIQREDGSWYGSWGVCFLYAIWFAVDAYTSMGYTLETSSSMKRACEFVVSKQRDDGSWGESYLSSELQEYTQSEEGLVVSTGWAMLVLSMARWPARDVLKKGAQFLINMQDEKGDWPQQSICGVFNKNCMISYSQYRNIFPIWGLAEYGKYLVEMGK